MLLIAVVLLAIFVASLVQRLEGAGRRWWSVEVTITTVCIVVIAFILNLFYSDTVGEKTYAYEEVTELSMGRNLCDIKVTTRTSNYDFNCDSGPPPVEIVHHNVNTGVRTTFESAAGIDLVGIDFISHKSRRLYITPEMIAEAEFHE